MDDSFLSAFQWAELVANSQCQFGDVPKDIQPEVKTLLDRLFEQETLPTTMTNVPFKAKPSNSIWNQMAAWRWN